MRTAEEQFLCEDEEDDLIGIPYDLMYNRDYMGSAGESNMLRFVHLSLRRIGATFQ